MRDILQAIEHADEFLMGEVHARRDRAPQGANAE